ncbi:MAG: hypothetical protein V2B18_11675, partial [Pseudomonadota bacterium]
MSKSELIELSREDLIDKIRELYEKHKAEPNNRVMITKDLNKDRIATPTGKGWNANRLNQFLKNNLPDIIGKAKAESGTEAPDQAVTVVPGEPEPVNETALKKAEVADVKPDRLSVVPVVDMEAVKTELRNGVQAARQEIESLLDGRIDSVLAGLRRTIDERLPAVEESVQTHTGALRTELSTVREELTSLFHKRIEAAAEALESRLGGELPSLRAGIDERSAALRTELSTVREELTSLFHKRIEAAVEALESRLGGELPSLRAGIDERSSALR